MFVYVFDCLSLLQISDLATVADFPEELDSFRQVLTRVDEFHRIRTRLSAEIADSSNIVKAMVCRFEKNSDFLLFSVLGFCLLISSTLCFDHVFVATFGQVIKAEDARLLAHMPTMRRAYNELHALNRELIGEYAKRANNHNQVC